MAFKQMLILVAFCIVVLPAIATAKTFMVGDDSGWRTGFDYQDWVKGKEFKTGDKLVFKYTEGAHTVLKVNGTEFQNCIKPPQNEALTTGNDVITLATPGDKWYICGVGNHCAGGQKMKITVMDANSAHGKTMSWSDLLIAGTITAGVMTMS
ncbi:hypothetical protein ACHQM5_019587 [Ranunculus cassubicifolius]